MNGFDDISKIVHDSDHRMKRAIEVLREEFQTVRTGRASTALVDRITIPYYGTPTPLNQVASVSSPEPRMLVVQPYDKTLIPEIEKAIMQSELGITPSNDGNLVRLPVPPLTEDRRKDLIKVVRHMAEEGRVAIRNVRRDANEHLKNLKKEKHVSEDEERRSEEQMQKKTDDYIQEIDHLLKSKETEIMEV